MTEIKVKRARRIGRRSVWALGIAVAMLSGVVPIARATEAPLTPYPERKWAPSAERYAEARTDGIRVRMSDGAVLIVDVIRPADPRTGKALPGPFPVILNQDLYAGSILNGLQDGGAPPPPNFFVRRGYIFVHSHDRGTAGSQGAQDTGFGTRIGLDGVELAYWSADPSNVRGSDGTVSLQGCSALGIIQLSTLAQLGRLQRLGDEVFVPGRNADVSGRSIPATVATNPIKAAVPECIAASQYREQFVDNGVPTTIFGLSAVAPVAGALIFGTSTDNVLSNAGPMEYSVDMLLGGDKGYDRQFWQERDWLRRADDIAFTGVPVLIWVGYGETGFIAAQELFAALQNVAAGRSKTAPMASGGLTSPKYRAIIGDWGHGGGLDKGIELEWFETWQRNADTGLRTSPGALLMKEMPTSQTRRWIAPASYPMTTAYQALNLGRGSLTSSKTAAGADQMVSLVGPQLSYTLGRRFREDTTVFGPAAVELWVESSTPNALMYLELQDVGPDGTATQITHGSIVASRSKLDPTKTWTAPNGLPVRPWLSLDADRPIQPNTPVKLSVPLQPVTWRLQAGHQLRLVVAPNPGDHCVPNSSLAAAPVPYGCIPTPSMATSLAGGTVKVLRGGDHASRLSIALVPSKSIPTIASGPTPTSKGMSLPRDW